jgi:translation initiation factor IF-1
MFEKDPREQDRPIQLGDGQHRAVEGIVRETLPYGQYRVEIEGPRQITAHAPRGPGRNFIRVLIGDRVRLELRSRDVTRGRIVEKL